MQKRQREIRVKNSLQKYHKNNNPAPIPLCPACLLASRAVIRFAGLESGLVLDIYCLMPYANTEQNWVVFAIERFRNRLSESEKWLNALLFL